MNLAVFTSIAVAGFVVAFMHAILPTHWLPFVLVGREQKWSAGKTMGVTALAGLGHVAFTVLIGAVVVAAGLAVAPRLEHMFNWVVAGLLLAMGVWYLLRKSHEHPTAPKGFRSDRSAVIGLVLLLTLSPCGEFVAVYFSAIQHGWLGFGLLSLVLLSATALAMMLFTGLTLAGTRMINLDALQKRESLIIGWILIVMAGVVLFFQR